MITILEGISTRVLDEMDARWLDAEGCLRLQPAREYLSADPDHFKAWCHRQARYCVPTVELIDFLRERIDGRKAIEVAAGNDDIGRFLGIPMTDSYVQAKNIAVRYTMAATAQPPTHPPRDVIAMDANEAVRRFRPKVVVASWLTRKSVKGVDVDGDAQASIFGADEEAIIRQTEMYLHIGCDDVHGEKTALSLPHEEIRLPGLVSRVADREQNVIYVWGG